MTHVSRYLIYIIFSVKVQRRKSTDKMIVPFEQTRVVSNRNILERQKKNNKKYHEMKEENPSKPVLA